MAGEGGFEFFPADSPFSPRHEAPFVIQGKTFHYVLQYLLYRKAERFNDKEESFSILQSRDMKVIERCGGNVRNTVPRIWNTERIRWAEVALEEKFKQNPALKEQLFATFPKTLVYANPKKDRFWSIGQSINPKTLSMKDLGDLNVYGNALTEIRDKLMKIENRLSEDGQGQDKKIGAQGDQDERRLGGEGNSHGVDGDEGRQDTALNSQRSGAQGGRDERRQGGEGNRHVSEGQLDGDERGNDAGMSSHGVEGQAGRGKRRKGGGGSSQWEGEQVDREGRRRSGRGNSRWGDRQVGRDRRRRGGRGGVRHEQTKWVERREGGGGNNHDVERDAGRHEQANWDERREDGGGNSHAVERQAGRHEQAKWVERRGDGGGNSHAVEREAGHHVQTNCDERREDGGGDSHAVEREAGLHEQANWDERREDGGGNSLMVEGQAGREERREGGVGNSHGVDGQVNWGERKDAAGRDSYGMEGQTDWDGGWQGGGGNSHLEGQASWDGRNQNGRWESKMTPGQASGDCPTKVHGWESKTQGIEEHASEGNNRQGVKGMSFGWEGQTTRGSKRKDGKRKNQRTDGHKAEGNRHEGHGWEVEKRHKGLEEQHLTGGEYKESDRISDWQEVADEMPQLDETEIASRHKRKETNEQTQRDWNKQRRKNTEPRNTKGFYIEMPNQDKFVLFFGNQSPFSQHHPAKFVIDGTEFNCAEQYMMYQKTVIFENKEMERKIMGTSNPVEQKRYGRQIPEFKFEVWKKHFIDVVERATVAKFTQNPHLQGPLFATYPKLLVEASPSDRLWGIGRSQNDPLAWDRETWRGKNQLGYIITRVRDRLMEKEDTHWAEWETWKDDKRWEEMEKEEKMKKRRWEQTNLDSGNPKERNPKSRRERDYVRDDMVTQKEDSPMYLSGRESYKHVSGKDNFEFFGGIKSPFSQHHPASFTVDGLTFASAEQYTLYKMAVMAGDRKLQKEIMLTTDHSKLKHYGQQVRNVYWTVWRQKSVQVVERSVIEKFSQNNDLKEKLFATYPKVLAMSEYGERFWSIGIGLGYVNTNSDAWDTNFWRGKNMLGYILTAVRDGLFEEMRNKELDVGYVRLQGTVEDEGTHDGKRILIDEGRTRDKIVVDGDKEGTVYVKRGRTDEDFEEDERRPRDEQDVKENWDDEIEEVRVRATKEDVEGTTMGEEKESSGTTLEVKTTEDVPSAPDARRCRKEDVESTTVGEKQSSGTMLEVKATEDLMSVPDASKEDVEGTMQEGQEEESNGTTQEVRTTEDIPCTPDASKEDVEGTTMGEEKESSVTMQEVRTTEDIPSSPDATKEDVEGTTVGEKESSRTMQEVRTAENIPCTPDATKEDVEGTMQEGEEKESKGTTQEVTTTDLTSVPHATNEDVEGTTMGEEKESSGTTLEVKTTEDILSAPDAAKEDVEGTAMGEEKESSGTMQEVKATEDHMSVPDASKTDVEGRRTIQKNHKRQVIKGKDNNVEEPTPAEEDFFAKSDRDNWREDLRRVTLQRETISDCVESVAVENNATPETRGEEVMMERGEDGMEQEKRDKANSEQAAVVGQDGNPQADDVQEGKDAPKGEVTDMTTVGEDEIVTTEEVDGHLQQS